MAGDDPTDTGGLFIGRRPGTGPRPRGPRTPPPPTRGGRRSAALRSGLLLAVEGLVVLTAWGPQPVAWIWVGSQLEYRTGSVMAGIAVAFLGLLASLLATLALATRLDDAWQRARQAAGHDQREGALARGFAVAAITALVAFSAWFWLLAGPGPQLAPR